VEEAWEIRWTPEAIDDLVSLGDFIAARNPDAAKKVVARIFDAARVLAEFPRVGRAGRVPGTRELVVLRTPYLVVYRIDEPLVEILRVVHGARQWPPS
jgi:toxin ParE1/3/4